MLIKKGDRNPTLFTQAQPSLQIEDYSIDDTMQTTSDRTDRTNCKLSIALNFDQAWMNTDDFDAPTHC